MKYTIEITIAGCSTNCAHCYVDGGYASPMSFEKFKKCIEKIHPLLNTLENCSVTLGNELFCNPDIVKILEYSRENLGKYFSYRSYFVPTTGIALLNKHDKKYIVDMLKSVGAKGFMLALHGFEKYHNLAVGSKIGYKKVFETASFILSEGLDVLYNIIVSKNLLPNISLMLNDIKAVGGMSRLTVPVFVPTDRMRKYQNVRADIKDCMEISEISSKYGIDTESLLKHCKLHTEKVLKESIENGTFNLDKELKISPEWVFLNITGNLDLYYGNAGAHTLYIGNLNDLKCNEIIDTVIKLPSNYDYTAYFSKDDFLKVTSLVKSIIPDQLVYPSYSDCICNILDKNRVKSILL